MQNFSHRPGPPSSVLCAKTPVVLCFLQHQVTIPECKHPIQPGNASDVSFLTGSVLSLTGQLMTENSYKNLRLSQKTNWILSSGKEQRLLFLMSSLMPRSRPSERELRSLGMVSLLLLVVVFVFCLFFFCLQITLL